MMSKLPAGRTKPRTELELRALHGSDLAVMIDTRTDRTEYFEMQKGFDRRWRSVLESALRVVAVGGRRMKCFEEVELFVEVQLWPARQPSQAVAAHGPRNQAP